MSDAQSEIWRLNTEQLRRGCADPQNRLDHAIKRAKLLDKAARAYVVALNAADDGDPTPLREVLIAINQVGFTKERVLQRVEHLRKETE
jgi:hypothetical protein